MTEIRTEEQIAKDAQKRSIQEITPDQIEKVYIGKSSPGRSCRCGCNGEYFTEGPQITRALRMIQAFEEKAEVDGNLVDLQQPYRGKIKKVWTIYLK